MKNKIKTKTNSEIVLVLWIWGSIGLIIGLIISSLFSNIGWLHFALPFTAVISSMLLGYDIDLEPVQKNEMVSVYNAISQSPLFCAQEMQVWKGFGIFRRISKHYDATSEVLELKMINTITKDDVKVTVDVKIDYRLGDSINFENEAGDKDYKILLENRARDYSEAAVKDKTLEKLEKTAKGDDFKTGDLESYFNQMGFKLEKIKMMNITTSDGFDEARQARKKAEFEAETRRYKNEEFRFRTQEEYLEIIASDIIDETSFSLRKKAEKILPSGSTKEAILNKAILLAKEKLPIDKIKILGNMRREAREGTETIEDIVPKQRYEGLGDKAKLWITPDK